MPVSPVNPGLGQPPSAYIPGPTSPNPEADVLTATYPAPVYAEGQEIETGVAAATVNAANQTVPGTPGPQGGFQLQATANTGATRTDSLNKFKKKNPVVNHVTISPLTLSLNHTSQITFLVLSPGSSQVQVGGSTEQLTWLVQDQNRVTILGQTVTFGSSATGVATVNSSGVVTPVAPGSTTITGTVSGGSGVTGTCTVTVVAAQSFDEPSGLTPVLNTGLLTVAPTTVIGGQWTNGVTTFSTAGSGGSPAYSASYLSLIPGGGASGYQIFYPQGLVGGYSPVRFGPTAFSTNGVAEVYGRFLVRLPAGYTTNGNVATKFFFFQSPGTTANHFVGGWDFGPPANANNPVTWVFSSGLQGPQNGPNTRTINCPSATNCADGNWHLCEFDWVIESVAGQPTGSVTMWVDQVLVSHTTGVTFFISGETPIFHSIFWDPIYGGPGFGPPAGGVSVQFDQVYISVR